VDPSKLVEGVRQVYGDEAFDALYGTIKPVPASTHFLIFHQFYSFVSVANHSTFFFPFFLKLKNVDRVRAVEDGEIINLGSDRPLQFIHTRGHAKHHFVVHDSLSKRYEIDLLLFFFFPLPFAPMLGHSLTWLILTFTSMFSTNSVFTGDAFGVSYRPILRNYRVALTTKPFRFMGFSFGSLPDNMKDFLFPSSSPVDFEPKEAHAAIDKILATQAERAFLTHGGIWDDMKFGAMQMHFGIQQYSLILQELVQMLKESESRKLPLDEDALHSHALSKMRKFFEEELQKHGLKHEDPEIWDLLSTDIELNAQGLVVAAHNFKNKPIF
jgi:hypothetical protein